MYRIDDPRFTPGTPEYDKYQKDMKATGEYLKKVYDRQAKRDAEFMSRPVRPLAPEWTKVDGVEVLRIKDSKYVAIPNNGRRNSANFSILDLTDRSDYVAVLRKTEVNKWLISAYKNEKDL